MFSLVVLARLTVLGLGGDFTIITGEGPRMQVYYVLGKGRESHRVTDSLQETEMFTVAGRTNSSDTDKELNAVSN